MSNRLSNLDERLDRDVRVLEQVVIESTRKASEALHSTRVETGREHAHHEALGEERDDGAPAVREVPELVAALHARALARCPEDAPDLRRHAQFPWMMIGMRPRTSIAPMATNAMGALDCVCVRYMIERLFSVNTSKPDSFTA